METFTLYWLGGGRQLVQGNDIAHAMNRAGIGNGALPALDFWASGDDKDYVWTGKKWKTKPGVPA